MMNRKRKTDAETESQADQEATPVDAPAGAELPGQGDGEAEGDTAETAAPSLQDQLAETHDRWLRTAAELDNARRRARLDVEEARRFGLTPLLTELLDVVDALQRALANANGPDDDPLLEGLRLTEQQFSAVLERHGVTPVDSALGQPTDPALHRVLVEQPGTDVEPGRIVTEITRGYRLHDRLLREAQVVVAAKPASAGSEGDHADV